MNCASQLIRSFAALAIVALAAVPGHVNAQKTGGARAESSGNDGPAKAMHGGILPLDTFGGDLAERCWVTGAGEYRVFGF